MEKICKIGKNGIHVRVRASTQDILGAAVRPPRIDPKWSAHHKRLTVLRNQFLKNKEALAEDSRKETPNGSGEHMADAATDSYDRDWALAMLSSDQNALYEIEQALKRIVDGAYGTCELSGKRIEAERLKSIPWTRFSAGVQQELEARGVASRPQLGELGACSHSSEGEDKDGEEAGEPSASETRNNGD
jgi:RNA polymerase-binding transcription factor DksA